MRWRLSIVIMTILFLMGHFNIVLAEEMTLKQKIGQMLIVGFKGMELKPHDAIAQAILAQQVGGVILFDYDLPSKSFDRNIKNPAQLKRLTTQLQKYAARAAIQNGNNLAPLFIGIDYEGGKVNRLKEDYGFPETLSAAKIGLGGYEHANQYARQMADILKEVGININFAPIIDVNVNPDNPIIGKLERSFSHDVQKIVDCAATFSKIYQKKGIVCAYKHFPGHGSSTGDTHVDFIDVTQTWQKSELEPYRQLLQQSYSCPMLMTAHIVHYGIDSKGYPASISRIMIKQLLRGKLNFKGIVITDDLQMKAITGRYALGDTIRLAINAGADILLFANQLVFPPQNPQQVVNMIYQDVKAGKIAESRINESYQRIIKLKERIKKNNLEVAD